MVALAPVVLRVLDSSLRPHVPSTARTCRVKFCAAVVFGGDVKQTGITSYLTFNRTLP